MLYFADFLILFAFLFVISDFFALSYGVFTTAGAIFFVVGTVILFSAVHVVPVFFIRIVLPTYVVLTSFAVVFAYLGYKAYRSKVKTGIAAIIGEIGEVVKEIGPGHDGKIRINGELWTAVSDFSLPVGSQASVLEMDGKLRLRVKPAA